VKPGGLLCFQHCLQAQATKVLLQSSHMGWDYDQKNLIKSWQQLSTAALMSYPEVKTKKKV
jgi:hypothetical protein